MKLLTTNLSSCLLRKVLMLASLMSHIRNIVLVGFALAMYDLLHVFLICDLRCFFVIWNGSASVGKCIENSLIEYVSFVDIISPSPMTSLNCFSSESHFI
ncbi:hypothetical protein E4T56_gene12216 [Termitomyces sp. T112]|nr:hypothetical protein E4T56_gene12216 [Termitomyces sp. T112]